MFQFFKRSGVLFSMKARKLRKNMKARKARKKWGHVRHVKNESM